MARSIAATLRDLLRKDPRLAIVLAEIIGPPPGLFGVPERPWEG